MYTQDREQFTALMGRMADLFTKKRPSDELVQDYWHALRDVTFVTVKECAERHMRYGKFFPKPFELRPREDKPTQQEDIASQARFEAAKAYSLANWRWLRGQDPVEFERRWLAARAARMEIIFADRPAELAEAHEQLAAEAARLMRAPV